MSENPRPHDIKRMIEVYSSGLYSHEELLADSCEIWEQHHVRPCPEIIKLLIKSVQPEDSPLLEESPLMEEYSKDMAEKLAWRDEIRKESASTCTAFQKWRERQMQRCFLELGESQVKAITYVPGAFELADGCSVNCWFCALNAKPLKSVYRYTPENAALWRDIQAVLKDILGPAARWSSSYWATEPLDNSDHEAFSIDFYKIHGTYPQTTTAVPLRNVNRTKALLEDSLKKGCLINRFSVHTGEALLAIHKNFSAEELKNTELLLENPENTTIMARVGRLYNLHITNPELAAREDKRARASVVKNNPSLAGLMDDAVINTSHLAAEECGQNRINIPGTIACIAGFLVRMIPKTIELVSPCAADDDWPCGYIVYDKRSFTDAKDFRTAVESLIKENMPESIEPGDDAVFSKRVNFSYLEDGFTLSTVFAKVTYSNDKAGSYLIHLGKLLNNGRFKAGEIAIECFYTFGQSESTTMSLINDMYNRGLLKSKIF